MKISFGARRSGAPLLFAVALLGAAVASAQAQTEAPPDELVVTGVPHERAPGELAQSVTVVTGDELDRNRAATLGETLANQVGVSSSYFGAGASRPIIRGLAGARVQMLEDGIDTMDAATVSDDHAVTVEPLAADQIEIFRGPTTLLYGSGAVGGVVNTVTTRVPTRRLRMVSRAHSSCAATRRGGAQRGRPPRRRRNALRVAFRRGPTRQRRLRDSGLCTRGRRRRQRRSRRRLRRPREQCRRERLGCPRRVMARRDGFLGLGFNTFDTVYGIPGHAHAHVGEEGTHEDHEAVRIDLTQRRLDLRGGWQVPRAPSKA